MKTLAVTEYVEKFDLLQKLREQGKIESRLESELEDELTDLWKQLSVDECKEVERRYPELKVAV